MQSVAHMTTASSSSPVSKLTDIRSRSKDASVTCPLIQTNSLLKQQQYKEGGLHKTRKLHTGDWNQIRRNSHVTTGIYITKHDKETWRWGSGVMSTCCRCSSLDRNAPDMKRLSRPRRSSLRREVRRGRRVSRVASVILLEGRAKLSNLGPRQRPTWGGEGHRHRWWWGEYVLTHYDTQ